MKSANKVNSLEVCKKSTRGSHWWIVHLLSLALTHSHKVATDVTSVQDSPDIWIQPVYMNSVINWFIFTPVWFLSSGVCICCGAQAVIRLNQPQLGLTPLLHDQQLISSFGCRREAFAPHKQFLQLQHEDPFYYRVSTTLVTWTGWGGLTEQATTEAHCCFFSRLVFICCEFTETATTDSRVEGKVASLV